MATVLDRPTLMSQGAPSASGPGGLACAVFLQNATAFSVPNNATTPVSTGWAAPAAIGQNVGGGSNLPTPVLPFNTATGVFTAPNPGTYTIQLQLQYASSQAAAVGNFYRAEIIRNGVTATPIARGETIADQNASGVVRTVSCDVTLVLAAGDTLTFNGFQNQGGAVALSTVAFANFLSINGG